MPPASASPDDDWTWLLLGGLALAGLAGFFLWRRRSATTETPYVEDAQPELAPSPAAPLAEPEPADAPQFLAPAPPKPTTASDGTIKAFQKRPAAKPAPAANAGYITAFRSAPPAPELTIELQPIRAGCTQDTGFLEYSFAVVNPADMMVGDVIVSAWMLSANAAQDDQLRDYLALPADPSKHNLFVLKPGEHRVLNATMGAPLDMLNIVEAGGRRFFAPLLMIDARYRAQNGATGRTSAAFMIGRPQAANGKLSPIFVDRGPRTIEGLAARAYPVPAI